MTFTAEINIEPLKSYYAQLANELRVSLPVVLRHEAAETVAIAMRNSAPDVSTEQLRDKAWRRIMHRVDAGGGTVKLTVNSGRRNPGSRSAGI